MPPTLDAVRAAADRVRPYLVRTPLLDVDGVHLKLECLQFTGSFKPRGFFAAALALPSERRLAGLLTVSAGNAAQACAFAASRLGVPCRVVMPDTAPAVKLAGVRRWGGVPSPMPRPEFVEWIERRGWEADPETFIHPFEDEEVMAGHGSAGLELIEDLPELQRVVVPVGGGGLIAGIAAAVKGLKPEVEVIGVQSDGYPLWPRAFEAGGRVALPVDTIADGTTPPWSEKMHNLLPHLVDRWLLVPEPRLRSAVAELAARAKVVAEGAGALAFAALEQLEPGPVTSAVVSGGNIDPALLAELLAG